MGIRRSIHLLKTNQGEILKNLNVDEFDDRRVLPSLKSKILGRGEVLEMFPSAPNVYFNAPEIDLDKYDIFLVFMSSGKDSLASLKYLLDRGVDRNKIELHHHLIDGAEGSNLMDWPFIESYTQKIAESLGIPLYMSWLKHGFEGEMLKHNSISHPHIIETPNNGLLELSRNRAKPGTRRKFPQVAASLQTRWCSSSLKVDVGRRVVTSQDRFINKNVLIITGERREESSMRSKYNQLEPHISDTLRRSKKPVKPRLVDSWRPVLHLSEEAVWEILSDWGIIAPVPYRLGWSRSSCQTCIFNSDRIFSTIYYYWPERLLRIAEYEREFGVTISRSGLNVLERAKLAKPIECDDVAALGQAMETEYKLPVFLTNGEKWKLPKGAFGIESSGAS